MISLFPFQLDASTTIANRYREFILDSERPRQKGYGFLPFYQSLHALTGAGKTPILADAVAQMRTTFPVEPIILWISKGKVVVDQTLANFVDGGKYHHLVDPLIPMPLNDCKPSDVADPSIGLLLIGTVATFNNKERGDRKIFGVRQDIGGLSLWDTLIERKTVHGGHRPLIIIYDEGHNLTDQQAELLLELHPEALVLASATLNLPPKLSNIIDLLKYNGYEDEKLQVMVSSTAVVEAELVKRTIQLGGYVASEEDTISALLTDYRTLIQAADESNVGFRPKCIYVCKTNVKDDEMRLFHSRMAPPIRIWRQLVEVEGVSPSEIAVYCDLKVSASQPIPTNFVLFKGGENDYEAFTAGNYKHVIFNLSLQEGWDDPECYLAYIDKSMGSELQVEQIIGRVLRQPGAKYYSDGRLNSCGFYIRIDEDGVFLDILRNVQHKLAQDLPTVEVISTGGKKRTLVVQAPRIQAKIPQIYTDMAAAEEAVMEVLDTISDYRESSDTVASGKVARSVQEIGNPSATTDIEWADHGHGMPVTVQWLLNRNIDRQYPAARAVCDTNDVRFTRLVHLGSRAAKQIEEKADSIVSTFLQHVSLGILPGMFTEVAEVNCDTERAITFRNSVHEAYSGLNPDEIECATSIDSLGWIWYRNPANGGLSLPLFQPGNRRSFSPDFVVWTDTAIWLIDPKGEQLIEREAGRKLIAIEKVSGQLPLRICLITQGTWDKTFNQINATGVTAWLLRTGIVINQSYSTIDKLLSKVIGSKR